MKFFLICLLFAFSTPETELINEVNKARELNGINALSVNWEVMRLAQYRSEEMVELDFFGHNSRIYGEPDEMLIRFGVPYTKAGVNIAKGQENAGEIVNAWLSSPEHRGNLLNPGFTSAGVGLSYDEGIPYWTLFFISE